MPKYIAFDEWKLRSAFGPDAVQEHIARIDTQMGYAVGTLARFEEWEGDTAEDIDNALRRRYRVPFAATNGVVDITKVPRVIKKWSWLLLDCKLLDARREAGSTGPDDSRIAEFENKAFGEMAKAADANDSPHPELALRSDLPESSGVSLATPIVVSYQMPWNYYDALNGSRR